jgi:hypothetical protein
MEKEKHKEAPFPGIPLRDEGGFDQLRQKEKEKEKEKGLGQGTTQAEKEKGKEKEQERESAAKPSPSSSSPSTPHANSTPPSSATAASGIFYIRYIYIHFIILYFFYICFIVLIYFDLLLHFIFLEDCIAYSRQISRKDDDNDRGRISGIPSNSSELSSGSPRTIEIGKASLDLFILDPHQDRLPRRNTFSFFYFIFFNFLDFQGVSFSLASFQGIVFIFLGSFIDAFRFFVFWFVFVVFIFVDGDFAEEDVDVAGTRAFETRREGWEGDEYNDGEEI